MNRRILLHGELVAVLGSSNVYFQPPESLALKYPCIVYSLENKAGTYANNKLYFNRSRYKVTIIDKNPDSALPNAMNKFSLCSFDRSYTADNLNHTVFTLYY